MAWIIGNCGGIAKNLNEINRLTSTHRQIWLYADHMVVADVSPKDVHHGVEVGNEVGSGDSKRVMSLAHGLSVVSNGSWRKIYRQPKTGGYFRPKEDPLAIRT